MGDGTSGRTIPLREPPAAMAILRNAIQTQNSGILRMTLNQINRVPMSEMTNEQKMVRALIMDELESRRR